MPQPSLIPHLDSCHASMHTSTAPRGDDLDADYVNEEYDRQQMVGAQNNADTTPRVATSMLSRSLSLLRTIIPMWKVLDCSLL